MLLLLELAISSFYWKRHAAPERLIMAADEVELKVKTQLKHFWNKLVFMLAVGQTVSRFWGKIGSWPFLMKKQQQNKTADRYPVLISGQFWVQIWKKCVSQHNPKTTSFNTCCCRIDAALIKCSQLMNTLHMYVYVYVCIHY